MLSGFWNELREFIRRLGVNEQRLDLLERRARALKQNLRDLQGPDGIGAVADTECDISGVINGCNSIGFPAALVEIRRQSDGVVLASLTCDSSGLYSTHLSFPGPSLVVTIHSTPVGSHVSEFASAGPITAKTLVAGANTVAAIVIAPALHYCCGVSDYFPVRVSKNVCFHVLSSNCVGTPVLPGATVTVPGFTPVVTDGSGDACVLVDTVGVHSYTITHPNHTTVSGTTVGSVTCSAGTNSTVGMARTTTAEVRVLVEGCGGYAEGCLVELLFGGVPTASATTDITGHASMFNVPNRTYAIRLSGGGWATRTTTISKTVPGLAGVCGVTGFNETVQLAWTTHGCHCFGFGTIRLPATLNMTDSGVGSCTLTLDPVDHIWKGEILGVARNGCASCPDEDVDFYYYFGCTAADGTGIANMSICSRIPPGVALVGGVCRGVNGYIPGGIYGTNVCPTTGPNPGGGIGWNVTTESGPPFVGTYNYDSYHTCVGTIETITVTE